MSVTPERTLNIMREFAREVVSRSKENLKKIKNTTGNLERSIDYDLKVSKNSFGLKFLAEPYGVFLDEGVKGANPQLVKNGVQKAPLSDFKFKKKKPPVEPLIEWAKLKRIRLRNEKGQFKKGNYRTIGFILQNRIFAQGIKPTLFFTRPYRELFKEIPKDVAEAYGLDFKDFLIKRYKNK